MRVLMVVQAYPPINVGGTMRALRWSNYLVSRGHNVSVICMDPDHEDLQLDQLLTSEISEEIDVRRVARRHHPLRRALDSRYLFASDSVWHEWKDNFEKELLQLISEYGEPAVTIISCPPFSLSSAQKLIRKHTHSRILLDLRDAWSQWAITPYPSKVHYLLTRRREHQAIHLADRVCVTSPTTRSELIREHGLDGRKIDVIENTFDQYTAPGEDSTPGNQKHSGQDTILITYTGNFYYNPYSQSLIDRKWYQKRPYQYLQYVPRKENWLYRSPYFAFKTFEKLFEQHPEYRSRVKIKFIGKEPAWWPQMLSQFELASSVCHAGIKSREDTMAIQNGSDFLLLTSNKLDAGKDYSIAGKTFDYFSSRKHIIALVTESDQKDILDASGTALCLDPDDVGGSAEKLHQLLSGELVLRPNPGYIDQYLTHNKLEKLSVLLQELGRQQR